MLVPHRELDHEAEKEINICENDERCGILAHSPWFFFFRVEDHAGKKKTFKENMANGHVGRFAHVFSLADLTT